MSDRIPLEIQREIIKRLDVKSVLRFRSVSKTLKSLIDSPNFVASYGSSDRIQKHVFLTSHTITAWSEYKSFVDDGETLSFGQTVVPLPPKGPDNFEIDRIIGSSHGLICFKCMYYNKGKHVGMYAIWNPFIRKSVGIEVAPSSLFKVYFGVCPVTLDPKVVRIITRSKKWLVEIYTLSSGSWRDISNDLLGGPLKISDDHAVVVTDRTIYWVATDSTKSMGNWLIVAFDLTSEEFKLIEIANFTAPRQKCDISKLRDSLVVLKYSLDRDSVTEKVGCEVWMMENVESKTMFKKLYNVKPSYLTPFGVRGFTKCGTPIFVTGKEHDCWKPDGLNVYELKSGRSTKITKLSKEELQFDVYNYHDTLLLLDR
ncbi:putative F-box protein At1g47790 [Rutidosis leptorrhynchoides]|uniref:putative F-box protein At1g47790 n=1 Tax=Rutidosis leptorrhynchoides TaxID=125765 RepID=UPI003A99E337